MGQVLHGSATTTEAVRRAIQHSQESLRGLAKRYGVNPNTIAKWKARTSVCDVPTGPKEPRSTILSVEDEVAPDFGAVAELEEVCSEWDRRERKMTKRRRKIGAALTAKIALEALREHATATCLAQRHQVHPNQIHGWKKHLLDRAARAFDPKVGLDTEAASARAIEKLHAKACPRT